jgi:hypothetical protein
MSDHDNMNDDIDGSQHAAPDIEADDHDSLFGENEPGTPVQDMPNNEEDQVTHSSERAQDQAPGAHAAEQSQDIVQILDESQSLGAHNVGLLHDEDAGHDDDDSAQEPYNNMDEDQDYDQKDVVESIEQVTGPEPASHDPSCFDADMFSMDENAHEHDDVTMIGTNAGDARFQHSTLTNGRDQVHEEEEEEHGESMHGIHNDRVHQFETVSISSGPQQPKASNFRSAHAEDAQLEDDSASLFIPEHPSSAATSPLRRGPTIKMPPRACSSAIGTKGSTSMFERIRNMQKANQERKNAISKQANASQYAAEPDNETYLEHVMSSINPPASIAAPSVDEDEMAHRQALAEFQRQQRHYNDLRRKNGGQLNFRQDVEWMKIRGAEEARKKKRARDVAKASEDTDGEVDLFPEAYPTPDAVDEDGGKDDESDDAFNFDSTVSSRKRRRREMPRIEPKRLTIQEAELQSMKVALEASDDIPKKKRKRQPTDDDSQDTRISGRSKNSKAKAKTTRSKTASKPAAKGPRKTAKSKRETENALKQASSLFNSNVFDQQAGADGREQPELGRSRNKQDALKELIASLPIEDKKQARSDMAVILAATKDFRGYAAVKAVEGGWLVKGMKTTLKGYQILGSAFMRRREDAVEEPRGGLMADQMGLVSCWHTNCVCETLLTSYLHDCRARR